MRAGAQLSVPYPLPRCAHRCDLMRQRWQSGAGADFRGDRHPVHVDQHALPVHDDQGKTPELMEMAERFLTHRRLLQLPVLRGREGGGKPGEHDPDLQPDDAEMVGEADRAFGLPRRIFPELVAPRHPCSAHCCKDSLTKPASPRQVIATCSHDTGAAVAAVPASGDDWAYLSSGTWSLIGVELPEPLINDRRARAKFHERSRLTAARSRFLKNIVGTVDAAGMPARMAGGRAGVLTTMS